jgi:hypothetical protein
MTIRPAKAGPMYRAYGGGDAGWEKEGTVEFELEEVGMVRMEGDGVVEDGMPIVVE